jgi:hypothetical protein
LYNSSRGLSVQIVTENWISNNGSEAEDFKGRISKAEGLEGAKESVHVIGVMQQRNVCFKTILV